VSSAIGRLLKLNKPVNSYDHFCVADWRRFSPHFGHCLISSFYRVPHPTSSSYLSRNNEFVPPRHSALFWLDPVA